MTNEFRYTTADLCAEFDLSKKTLRKRAAILAIGINREGRKGFLYTEADRLKLIESMRPTVATPPRRRRRAA